MLRDGTLIRSHKERKLSCKLNPFCWEVTPLDDFTNMLKVQRERGRWELWEGTESCSGDPMSSCGLEAQLPPPPNPAGAWPPQVVSRRDRPPPNCKFSGERARMLIAVSGAPGTMPDTEKMLSTYLWKKEEKGRKARRQKGRVGRMEGKRFFWHYCFPSPTSLLRYSWWIKLHIFKMYDLMFWCTLWNNCLIQVN